MPADSTRQRWIEWYMGQYGPGGPLEGQAPPDIRQYKNELLDEIEAAPNPNVYAEEPGFYPRILPTTDPTWMESGYNAVRKGASVAGDVFDELASKEFIYPTIGAGVTSLLPFPKTELIGAEAGYLAAGQSLPEATKNTALDAAFAYGAPSLFGRIARKFPSVGKAYGPDQLFKAAKDTVLEKTVGAAAKHGGNAVRTVGGAMGRAWREFWEVEVLPEPDLIEVLERAMAGLPVSRRQRDALTKHMLNTPGLAKDFQLLSGQIPGPQRRAMQGMEGMVVNHPASTRLLDVYDYQRERWLQLIDEAYPEGLNADEFGEYAQHMLNKADDFLMVRDEELFEKVLSPRYNTPNHRERVGTELGRYLGIFERDPLDSRNVIDRVGRLRTPKQWNQYSSEVRELHQAAKNLAYLFTTEIPQDEEALAQLAKTLGVSPSQLLRPDGPVYVDSLRRKVGNAIGKAHTEQRTEDVALLEQLYGALVDSQGSVLSKADRVGWEEARKMYEEYRKMRQPLAHYLGQTTDSQGRVISEADPDRLVKLLDKFTRSPKTLEAAIFFAEKTGDQTFSHVARASLLAGMLEEATGFQSFARRYKKLNPRVRRVLMQHEMTENAFQMAAFLELISESRWAGSNPGGGAMRATFSIDGAPSAFKYLVGGYIADPILRNLNKIYPELASGEHNAMIQAMALRFVERAAVYGTATAARRATTPAMADAANFAGQELMETLFPSMNYPDPAGNTPTEGTIYNELNPGGY